MKFHNRHLWKEVPFIRILPTFAVGYLLSDYRYLSSGIAIVIAILAILILSIFRFLSTAFSWKYNAVRGLAIQLIIITIPSLLTSINSNLNGPDDLLLHTKQKGYLLLQLKQPLDEKQNSFSSVVKIFHTNKGDTKKISGYAIVYFSKKDPPDQRITTGSYLLTGIWPTEISTNKNPGTFDYKKWMAAKNTHYQFFLKQGNFIVIDGKRGNHLNRKVFELRDGLLNILRTNIKDSTACGLAEALLLGYRNDIDDTLMQAYSNTGVVHVIAISGLHLGLIYIILMKICAIVLRDKGKRFIQPIIVISALWIFTLLSGASASVVRSAVMFTLLAIGNAIGRKSHSINSLASSAFLLLCYHPSWLKDIGFQLSYSAVASILFFHKKIMSLYIFTNPLANKFWEMIALTLAAQILTAPLLLYYFHKFPLLFLFTNIVAVPLSSFILSIELFLCAVSSFPVLAIETGQVLQNLIVLMNDYVLLMDRIPNSVIESVRLDVLQTVFIYLIIFLIFFRSGTGKKTTVFILLCCLAAFSGIRAINHYNRMWQEKIVILNSNGNTVLIWIQGMDATVCQFNGVAGDKMKLQKLMDEVCFYYGVRESKTVKLYPDHSFLLTFDQLRILLVNGKNAGAHSSTKADILLLTGNVFGNITMIARQTSCRLVIADASSSLWKIQEWKKEVEQLHLRFLSVPERGAFLLDRDQFKLSEAVFADLK